MTRLPAHFLVAAVLAASAATLMAQPPTKRVYLRALDGRGNVIADLRQADVAVTEDGVPREVTSLSRTDAPMRILLVVDTSSSIGPLLTPFRAALNAFLDVIPDSHEIALVGTGGQLHVRAAPTADRDRLRAAVATLAPDGGSDTLLDSLLESNKRFLGTAPGQWPVVVILATDAGGSRGENHIDAYNTFVGDFVHRGGSAHAVVLPGRHSGIATDIAMNITGNSGGIYSAIAAASGLPNVLRRIAERIAADYRRSADGYEVEYRGGSSAAPEVNVAVARSGATVVVSTRRPF